MALWLNRRLAVDLSTVDAGSDTRKQREAEHYLLWLMLVPGDRLPGARDVESAVSWLERAGFDPTAGRAGITLYPAEVGDEELELDDVVEAAVQLSAEGGGLLLGGRGAGIAFVCDPGARVRRETIRRAGLADEASFGEFSIWMPRPVPRGGNHDEVAAAVLAVLSAVQDALHATCCFAVTTDDLAPLFPRWAYHRLLKQTERLSELFWYQWFGAELSSGLPVADYKRAGCVLESAGTGIALQLTDLPAAGLPKLEGARDRWLHSLIPRRVC